jgi:hypothetical protein
MIQTVIDFVVAHQVAMTAVAVAVIDFAIELNPALKSNSIISAVLSLLVKKPQA